MSRLCTLSCTRPGARNSILQTKRGRTSLAHCAAHLSVGIHHILVSEDGVVVLAKSGIELEAALHILVVLIPFAAHVSRVWPCVFLDQCSRTLWLLLPSAFAVPSNPDSQQRTR